MREQTREYREGHSSVQIGYGGMDGNAKEVVTGQMARQLSRTHTTNHNWVKIINDITLAQLL